MTLNNLFIIYILTIVIVRIFLTFFPMHAHKIGKFQPHHYMYGLVLIAIYFLIPNPILLSIGGALFVDEIPLFFIFHGWDWPDDHWKQYHSWQSIVGIIFISLLGFWVIV